MLGGHDTFLKPCSDLILQDQWFNRTIFGLIFTGQFSNWIIEM
jgi:hypothetical protein